jgi:hypothetical protein
VLIVFSQKEHDILYYRIKTPLEILKNENINMGKLDKTELIWTNMPPTDKSFSFQPVNLFSVLSSIFQSGLLKFIYTVQKDSRSIYMQKTEASATRFCLKEFLSYRPDLVRKPNSAI